MKRKYSNATGGTAKKAAPASQKYDARSGRWMVVPKSMSAKAAQSLRSAVMEKKGMDTAISLASGSVTNTTNDNSASFVLNLIQQGAGSWNRVGRKVTLKSLRIQGQIQCNIYPSATSGILVDNIVRMVVVWDKQPSGAAIPRFDDIFGVTAQDGTESCPNIYCPPRYDNMDRFRVLRDICYEFDPESSVTTGTINGTLKSVHVDEYLKLSDLEVVFSGQSSPMTIADISSGALYCYFRAFNNTATSNQALLAANARIRYTD